MAEYDLPAIPSLPRRCPAEGMIAQAVVGINGVTAGQYGSIAVDPAAVDPYAPVLTDVATDSFSGLRHFLDHAVNIGLEGPIKWQFVGPVTLGVALTRAGLSDDVAFAVAARAVRSHVMSLSVAVAAALPRSPQIVVHRRAVVRGAVHARLPDRPGPGDRLAVGRHGECVGGGHGRGPLLR